MVKNLLSIEHDPGSDEFRAKRIAARYVVVGVAALVKNFEEGAHDQIALVGPRSFLDRYLGEICTDGMLKAYREVSNSTNQ